MLQVGLSKMTEKIVWVSNMLINLVNLMITCDKQLNESTESTHSIIINTIHRTGHEYPLAVMKNKGKGIKFLHFTRR